MLSFDQTFKADAFIDIKTVSEQLESIRLLTKDQAAERGIDYHVEFTARDAGDYMIVLCRHEEVSAYRALFVLEDGTVIFDRYCDSLAHAMSAVLFQMFCDAGLDSSRDDVEDDGEFATHVVGAMRNLLDRKREEAKQFE